MANRKKFVAKNGITVGTGHTTTDVIDQDGHITANTVTISGTLLNATAFAGTANNASYLEGSNGSYYTGYSDNKAANAYSNATTYASNASNITTGTLTANVLATSGVTANTYGNSSSIPVITIDDKGRITSATTNAVAGVTGYTYTPANSTFIITTGAGSTFPATITTANDSVDGVIKVVDSVSNVSIYVAASANSVKTAYDNATTAYSNAATYADNKAANAYSNAVSYAGTIAGTAYSNATTFASSAAATAYSNAVSAASSSAATAYSNATTFAANATNISSGTLAEARLPFRMDQNVRTNDSVSFGNMTITGNLTVTGTTVTVNANNLSIQDNMIYLNSNSSITNPDLGIAGNYNDGTYRHAGFFRDASDGVWKVFDQYLPEPDASPYIDTANASFRIANFQANVVTAASFSGNGASVTSVNAATVGGLNASTSATASTIVARDSGGDITGRYFFGVHFNQSSSNSENPTIAAFWTNSGSDNYCRKSTPAHVISQLGLWTSSNDGSGSGLDADLLDGQNSAGFLRGLSGGSEASVDTYTDNGFRTISYTGHSKSLLSFDVGGSTGPVQQEFHYGTPSNGWRIRNKTDSTTWSSWGYVVMTTANQGHLSGTVWHSGNDGSGSGLDADLWDGYQFADYLNQAVKTNSSPSFSGLTVTANKFLLNSDSGGYGQLQINSPNTSTEATIVFGSGGSGQNNGGYTYAGVIGLGAYGLSKANFYFGAGYNAPAMFIPNSSAHAEATNSFRAPIFYDSANTSFYVDSASTSNINVLQAVGTIWTGYHGSNAYNGGSGASLYFGGDTAGAYRLWTQLENINGNYTKLNIDWHTGIKIGAYWNYGGIRFYDDAIGYGSANGHGNKVFSVAEGDTGVRAYYSMHAPIYYDSANTSFFVDPASRSRLSTVDLGNSGYYMTQGDWGWRHQTPDGWIQFGPANSGHAHIYTDRSNFYFNVNTLYTNGNLVWTSANDGSGSTLDADTVDGIQASSFLRYNGGFAGNWQTLTDSAGELRIDQVNDINGGSHSNQPPNVYTYGGVLSWRADNHSFQLYASHTGDLTFKTQWNNDNYSGWRRILHESNIGSFAWTSSNDGSGSGLDADLLDGYNLSSSASGSTVALRDGSARLYTHLGEVNKNNDWVASFQATPVSGYTWHGDISTGGPTGTWWFYESMRHSNSGNYWGTQIAWGWEDNANQLYQRNVTANSWSGWVKYWNSGNDGSGSGLDADLLDGVDSSGFARARTRSNWNDSTVINNVIGQLAWKNYGGAHTIFDASASTSPDGTSINNTNAAVAWTGSYPTLMGWNGSSTYGVRVDSARVADSAGAVDFSALTNKASGTGTYTTSGDFRAPIFYDSNDTSYYLNPNGLSSLHSATCWSAWYFRSNRNTSSDSPPLQAYSDDSGGAIMSFHRANYYAVNFGLDSDNVMRIGGWSAAANRWQLDMSGNMTVAGNVTAYSDIRLKTDIQVIENAIEKVKQIRGVTFKRIDEGSDGMRQTGVIAQEVELVLPEAVSQDNEGIKNVAYGNMVGLLIEAIKEQQKQIEELKAALLNK